MSSKVKWRPDEPARHPLYRKLHDRITNQDQCITFLLVELRTLQKRVDKLERARARSLTENTTLDESPSALDQYPDL
jgi:hypothetical protein